MTDAGRKALVNANKTGTNKVEIVSVLAYDPGHAQEMAKGGVLIGSIISAIIGYSYLRIVGARRKECHIGVYHNC